MADAVGILLAAGASSRMGRDKMFIRIGGKTVLERSMAAMKKSGCFTRMIVVCRRQDWEAVEGLAQQVFGGSFTLVEGGSERQYSVANALAAAGDAEIVAVHDAARCFAPPQLFCRCVDAARKYGAAAAGVPRAIPSRPSKGTSSPAR
jgi:2-C-methyl-D-erythritol 4-phosphate cytidylyltransferase